MNYSTICRLTQPQSVALTAILWLLVMGFPTFAQVQLAPAKQWDKRFGGTRDEYLGTVIATTDGGYLLVGYTRSDLSGDITQPPKSVDPVIIDGWVVKISGSGTKQWDKRYGGPDGAALISAVATPDGGYLLAGNSSSNIGGDVSQTGYGSSDYWVIKVTSNGTKQWDKRYGGNSIDHLRTVIATSDGGYLLAGNIWSDQSGEVSEIKRGAEDYWIVKISSTGAKQWDKRLGGKEYNKLQTVMATSDGGYLLVGYSDAGISGDKTQASQGSDDGWIVKVNSSGIKQWDRRFGGTQYDVFTTVLATSDGGYLLAGTTSSDRGGDVSQFSKGDQDYWIVKVSNTGTKQWDKRYGAEYLGFPPGSYSYLESIVATADGGYALLGNSTGQIGNDKTQANCTEAYMNYWLIKIDNLGTKKWDRRFGGNRQDNSVALLQTTDGGFLLAGNSDSGISCDKSQPDWRDQSVLNSFKDYWLVKTEPEQPFRYQYLMSNTAVTACSGSFYDSGFTGYYANNSSFTKTFTPATAGYRVQVSFEDFETEANYDQLSIYNGPSTSSPLIGTYTGKNSPGIITATNPTGQLTFKFSSDYSVTKQGWRAKLTCLVSIAHGRLANAEEAREAEPSTQLKVSPNPFTDQATLSFQLPQTQAVRLLVYDSQGREVRTLFDGQAQADVPYTFDFSGQGRTPGLYIARLLTNSGTHQQKLILGR